MKKNDVKLHTFYNTNKMLYHPDNIKIIPESQ